MAFEPFSDFTVLAFIYMNSCDDNFFMIVFPVKNNWLPMEEKLIDDLAGLLRLAFSNNNDGSWVSKILVKWDDNLGVKMAHKRI